MKVKHWQRTSSNNLFIFCVHFVEELNGVVHIPIPLIPDEEVEHIQHGKDAPSHLHQSVSRIKCVSSKMKNGWMRKTCKISTNQVK